MLGYLAYPTYQIFLAMGFSAALVLLVMPLFIRIMRRGGLGQQIRADGPQRHLQKQGTPTMGGVIILIATFVSTALFAPWTTSLMICLGATAATAALGLLDDVESVAHARSLGLTPLQKMIGLGSLSCAFCLIAVNVCGTEAVVHLPFIGVIRLDVLATNFVFNGFNISIPWLYLIFVFLLFAGMSNAVNLTDGLDGLASGCALIVFLALGAVSFRSNMLGLAVFSASLAGGLVGFLWFNSHPATIFMGDTGSLAFGAALAALAVLTKSEATALVMGGIFIVEACSVIAQVASFKLRGKRVLLMAPLHHHFEKLGWSETKVVLRFWIVSAAFAALGFALYFQQW